MSGLSKGAREGQSWGALQWGVRDTVPQYSTGDKRPGPLDDEVLPNPSGQTQIKRARSRSRS